MVDREVNPYDPLAVQQAMAEEEIDAVVDATFPLPSGQHVNPYDLGSVAKAHNISKARHELRDQLRHQHRLLRHR